MPTEIPSIERTDELPSPAREFTMCFTSTDRGARLARRLATSRMAEWGFPLRSEPSDTVTLIVAELTANAVRHGRVPGRDFRLRLLAWSETVRIEVTDTRAESLPPGRPAAPAPDAESGRGLWLVAQLAVRWAITPRADGPGKTVWAEVSV